MELNRLQKHWTAFGKQDPLWAILTTPGKRGGAWDLDEFFATGRPEVDEVLRVLAERDIPVEHSRALDFGCGVGRLTQALAKHFDSCDGVDVAETMITRARELNRNSDRVRFHHNGAADLRLFEDGGFDFVLALIVLQHMEPQLMRGYMREFLRVLRPGGVAFFNVPERYMVGEELPPEGYRASVSLIGAIPALVPGQISPVNLKIRNDSPVPWPVPAQLRVGNHWLSTDGRVVVFDDGRTVLESAVEPGGECEVELDVVAPGEPGEYQLEIDLLQEWITWFADRGSSTLRVPISVIAAPAPAATAEERNRDGDDATLTPAMEMHVMSREDVVETVEEAGGVVLEMMARDRCGPAIPSVDYIVARAMSPVRSWPRDTASEVPDRIEARIRAAIDGGASALREPSIHPLAPDPRVAEQRRRARTLMDERLDLVGFRLTSTRGRLGQASVVLRSLLRRAMYQVLHRQTEFNRAANDLIRALDAQLETLGTTVKMQLDLLAAADERVHALELSRRDAVQRTVELERRVAREEIHSAVFARRARTRAAAVAERFDYLGFLERFRGSTEIVKERLRMYVPRFEGCSDVVDIGCGRGEFLELLKEVGISAVGVDPREEMVDCCRRLGFEAVHAEPLRFLLGRPRESHGGLFVSHLVEHLGRDDLVELIRQAFRVLRPGGVIVLETMNPESLVAFVSLHGEFAPLAPVPAPALRWLAESCGFEGVETEYTSPAKERHRLVPLPASVGKGADVDAFNRAIAAADEFLYGFQEYALVGRKPA